MARKAKTDVKVIKVGYGFFGEAHSSRIQREAKKWMSRGYELQHQEEAPGGCFRRGYTLLTFVKRV